MGKDGIKIPIKIRFLFNISVLLQRKMLKERYGKKKADIWLKRARERFKPVYQKIPDIGGNENMMNPNLVLATFLMPIAIVMKEEGLSTREIGENIFNFSKGAYNFFLPLAKRLSYFEKSKIDKMRLAAERSLLRRFPEDWVFEFVEGGEDYLFGYDIRECGLHKFWKSQGLEELVPYLCLTDWAKWKLLGVSVDRTKTIANGHDVCDFRYCRKKKECPSGWPPESNVEWTGKFEAK